jgi:hypothetical protein
MEVPPTSKRSTRHRHRGLRIFGIRQVRLTLCLWQTCVIGGTAPHLRAPGGSPWAAGLPAASPDPAPADSRPSPWRSERATFGRPDPTGLPLRATRAARPTRPADTRPPLRQIERDCSRARADLMRSACLLSTRSGCGRTGMLLVAPLVRRAWAEYGARPKRPVAYRCAALIS